MCFAMTLPPWVGEPACGDGVRCWHEGCHAAGYCMERMVSPPRHIEIVDEIGVAAIQSPPLPPPETDDGGL